MAWPFIVLCMVLSLCVVGLLKQNEEPCLLNHAGNTSASALNTSYWRQVA